ncbi:MAG TPA: carboxynorspermidine decarboxylase [Elusimicrobiota bacterium]|nr:carboxynorspermidine decarboxylase [Elusimicrobiota bacterium]
MNAEEKPIEDIVRENAHAFQTPYYLIDETRLLKNLKRIALVRERSGAKSVLALKCFSTWSVFGLMRRYMDGTTSSSLYEARLGHEKFGKEVHAYCVAFSPEDIEAVRSIATKVIFNSTSQLKRYRSRLKGLPLGLRINPGVSHSHFDLADPARRYSRLGVSRRSDLEEALPLISGAMFHCQCENDRLESFCRILDHIGEKFGSVLRRLEWVSLGGGIYFTQDGYPLDGFCRRLAEFSKEFRVQVYLEPGETAITRSGFLVTKVLDIVHNERDIAIVDAAVEPHMLDLLIYRTDAKIDIAQKGKYTYTVAGRTCLAGDVFGTYRFPEKLRVGSLIPVADASGYTMVKKNWFNGVQMPSIVVRRLNGRLELVKRFQYKDYLTNLS